MPEITSRSNNLRQNKPPTPGASNGRPAEKTDDFRLQSAAAPVDGPDPTEANGESSGQNQVAATTRRPTMAELEAAIGPQADIVTFGKAEARYECTDKIVPGRYFRTPPDRGLWLDTPLLIDVEGLDKSPYAIAPAMQVPLHLWLRRYTLVPALDQDGNLFIYRIAVADLTMGQRAGRSDETRRRAVQEATETWLTIVWDGKKHVTRPADAPKLLGEPKWPDDLSRSTIIWRTFQDRYIDTRDHPIAQVYLGIARR